MPQPALHTVVFDLGNVLIDWNPRHLYRAFFQNDDAAMEHFLSDICTREWHERHDAGASFVDNAAPLLQKYAGDARMQELIRAWGPRFAEMLRPMPESVEILHQLHRAGIALYALTNWPAEAFVAARQQFPLLSLFKDIVVSGDEGVKKPDARIYDILIKRTGIDPRSAVYIDDREENLIPAAALGFTTIQFTTPVALAMALCNLNLLPLKECA